MARKEHFTAKTEYEKEFFTRFKQLCYTRSSWQVWEDVIGMMACAIANSVEDRRTEIYMKREKEYSERLKRLGGDVQLPAEMFGIITMALEENPEQDFLGNMFMNLELGNHWKGQFFTPYCICQLMAEISAQETQEKIENNGWATYNDCACGAGATMIAASNALKNRKIDYSNHALFIGQDIDRTAAQMCYIQLSLLGCAGYVVVANSLTNPIVGDALRPTPQDGQEFWFMPVYQNKIWRGRRLCRKMDLLFFAT